MSRAEKILNILQKRQPQAEQARQTLNKLRSLLGILTELERCRERSLARAEDIAVKEKLRELSFTLVREKINEAQEIIIRLEKRFSRAHLAIAFVGRAGQGKSRLIQAMTGLTKAEVPDGSVDNCTGVKCTITHQEGREPYAEVYFHNKDSFLQENIAPYYEVLGLGDQPTSFQSFIHNSLPELNQDSAEAKSYYAFLSKCHSNYSEYQELLEADSPARITRQDIRKYVSQTDENNQRNYFNYLAVREVRIYCAFGQSDISKICLIDLPGLGDTVLGDKDRVRRSIGNDVDFALFIYMPQGTRILQEEHYKLYDIAQDALTELSISKWSFMVLNQVITPVGEGIAINTEMCQEIKQRIETQQRIKVVKCLIADCTNKDASAAVLVEVIDELEKNLLNLDNEYALVGNTAIKNFQAEFNRFLVQARQAFTVAPTGNENDRFRSLFNEFRESLGDELLKYVEELKPTKLNTRDNTKDINFFTEQIDGIIARCQEDTGIPHPEEIRRRARRVGARGGYPGVFVGCLDELRTHIRGHFSSVDNGLKEYVDKIKNQVAEIFISTPLGNLTSARDKEFLQFMAEEIPLNKLSLKKAFQKLYAFEMNYRNNFQYRILDALEVLDPKVSANILRTEGRNDAEISQAIEEILKGLHRQVIFACQEALEGFQGEPSLAIYAAVDEFVDEVARSKDTDDQWYDFLRDRSSQIWLNEFGKQVREEKREWEELLQKADEASKFKLI